MLQDIHAHQRLLDEAAELGLGGAERVFRAAPLGDVARHRLHPDELSGGIGDQPRVLTEPHFATRPGDRRELDIRVRLPCGGLLVVVVEDLRPVIGADEFGETTADHFIRGVLEHPQGLRIDEPEVAFGVGFENDVGRRIEEVTVAVFARLQAPPRWPCGR